MVGWKSCYVIAMSRLFHPRDGNSYDSLSLTEQQYSALVQRGLKGRNDNPPDLLSGWCVMVNDLAFGSCVVP